MYNHYNRKYFNSELPADTVLIWSPCDDADAICDWPNPPAKTARIRIDPSLTRHTNATKLTLLHEMIHVKLGRAGHGKKFWAEVQRLWEAEAWHRHL